MTYIDGMLFCTKFLENVLGNHDPSVINNSFTAVYTKTHIHDELENLNQLSWLAIDT